MSRIDLATLLVAALFVLVCVLLAVIAINGLFEVAFAVALFFYFSALFFPAMYFLRKEAGDSQACEEAGQAYLAEVEAKAEWMAGAANEDVADILVGEIIAGRRELLTAFCSHGRSFTIHTDIPFSSGIEAVAKEEWEGGKVYMDMEFCSDSIVFDYIRGFVVEASEKGANFEVYAHSERRHAIYLQAQPCYKARTAK